MEITKIKLFPSNELYDLNVYWQELPLWLRGLRIRLGSSNYGSAVNEPDWHP